MTSRIVLHDGDIARARGWQIRDFRTARKAARIGVPSAVALGALGGALAAVVSRRQDGPIRWR